MSSPGQAAGAGTGLDIVGAGLKAFGQYKTGESEGAMYNYQSGLAQTNASIAKQDAIYATQTGEVEAQQSGMRTRSEVGSTKVGYGAGNISTSSGSSKNVIASETSIGQANEAVIRANAAKRAYGFNVASAEDTAQAGVFSEAAHTSRTSATLGIASTIVGAASSVSSKWSQASQSFGTGNQGDDTPIYGPGY